MNLAVDKPILNSPFAEPTRYWFYDDQTKLATLMTGRRPAGYYFRTRASAKAQMTLFTEEQFVELEAVNQIRVRVGEWRRKGYPAGTVTPVTRKLLQHWNREDRARKLFFCQREAVETIIWLTEVYPKGGPRVMVSGTNGRGRKRLEEVLLDHPVDAESVARGFGPLRRYGCKMATGSGKTVVMAMVAAWSIINKAHKPKETLFSDAVLVVCPNLTVKERLGGGEWTDRSQFEGASHDFTPDFLVRLTDGTTLILEVKGHEDEVDRAKYEAARKWVRAVNNWGELGRLRFEVCKDTKGLKKDLQAWLA